MKIALCYDRINKFGGAERVLQALHELWPEAPIYTLTYDADQAKWANGWDIRSSFLQKLPVIGRKHELFPALAPLAWEQFDFNEYDVVISITSAEAKAIITAAHTLHICYCLTPTRYLWSGYFDYLQATGFGIFHQLVRRIFSWLSYPLRVWDYYFARRPDIMVGISDEVCGRIRKYYRRESIKIYPPVEAPAVTTVSSATEPYFLIVSRLVPYKRVDLVVEAFTRLGWRLKVIGVGSELDALKSKGAKNIEFLGFLPDKEIAVHYQNCSALIFPSFEDFGIVPVEAQSAGTPVIAYGRGGALETVVRDKTGLFFTSQSAEGLITLFRECCAQVGDSALSEANMVQYLNRFNREDCRTNARLFAKENFQKAMQSLIERESVKKNVQEN